MDAAGVTTIGLGIVVRPVLVLSAPGVIETYEQLDRVREKMNGRFEEMFEDAGFILLAWADAGQGRLMSTTPILRPADLKLSRPWAWEGRSDLCGVFEGRWRQCGTPGRA